MTLLRLSPLALSRSRFALSPLAETLATTIMLAHPVAEPWVVDWHARHRPAFAATVGTDPFDRGLVALVSTTKWLPAHVVVPPTGGMGTALETELADVAGAPDAEVRAELAESVRNSWERHDLTWLTGQDWARRTADLLRRVWHAHVAPDWPRRRAVLERDVTHRAGLLAAHGWPRALHRMSRRSGWVGADTIRFSDQPFPDRVVGDEGMLFVPVTTTSGTWLCEAPPDRYALVYPARGPLLPPPEPVDRALSRLIGPVRARILAELARPATPSELAAHLRLSVGTVGGHLAVLRAAQLVAGARVGRRVVYRRTPTGDLLAAPPPAR
jgi:DNA-binding transcriptional ArsR family regulator